MSKINSTEEALAALDDSLKSMGMNLKGEVVSDPNNNNKEVEKETKQMDLKEENGVDIEEEGLLEKQEQPKQDEIYNPEIQKAIESQKVQFEQLRNSVEVLKKLLVEQTHSSIKNEMKLAIEKNDKQTLDELKRKESELLQNNQSTHPEVYAFTERNRQWMDNPGWKETEMKQWALWRDKDLMRLNLNPKEHMERLEADIKEKYADYFKDEQKAKPKKMVLSDNGGIVKESKRRYTINDLNDAQRKVLTDLGSRIDPKSYIESLIKAGQLK